MWGAATSVGSRTTIITLSSGSTASATLAFHMTRKDS